MMAKMLSKIAALARNDDGAAMVEYSLLIGLITVAVITALIFVGDWVAQQWTDLQTNLNSA